MYSLRDTTASASSASSESCGGMWWGVVRRSALEHCPQGSVQESLPHSVSVETVAMEHVFPESRSRPEQLLAGQYPLTREQSISTEKAKMADHQYKAFLKLLLPDRHFLEFTAREPKRTPFLTVGDRRRGNHRFSGTY